MYATDAAAHYTQHSVATSSPAGLVLVLYDSALSSVTAAKAVLAGTGGRDLGTVSLLLGRAQEIITELELALDHDRGGQIAASLQSLYEYARERLIEANLRKDPEPLEDVTMVISGLRHAWSSALLGEQA